MIDDFLTHLAARGTSDSTIALRRFHLRRLDLTLPRGLKHARTSDLEAILARAGANEYRRSVRSSMKQFYWWATEAGYLDTDPAITLEPVRPGRPRPRPASDHDLTAAFATADPRTTLMLRLAAEAGLRRAEIATIHRTDLFDDLMGWSLRVHGKGDKERVVPLSDDLARLTLRSFTDEWLFPGPSGHLTPAHVGKLISAVLPAGVTPHKLRHRFATRCYAATHDLFAVQQLLGHESPETTQRYVAIDAARLRAVAAAA